jgi:peptide/nickel transport system substrate-binding protein
LLRAGALGVTGVASWGLSGCAAAAVAPTAPPAVTNPPTPTAVAAAPAPAATAAPQRKYGGKFLGMGTSPEAHLDPHMNNGPSSAGAIGAYVCYSQLLTLKWGPEVNPPSYIAVGDLAASWTQPDDITYLFKLQPGAKFHNIAPVNGRDLTADDIVYSYQRIRDLKAFAAILSGITKFEAPDKATVKLTLEKPNADQLATLADYRGKIVAREVVEKNQDLTKAPVIGSGAWIFEDFVVGERFSAKRNPDFFIKGTPYADGIETFRAKDASTLPNALRTKSINVLGSTQTADTVADLMKAIPNLQVQWTTADSSGDELGVKVTEEPFTDLRVRQAINKAIDRKQIIDTLYFGKAVLSPGIILPQADWILPDAELQRLRARDVEGARQLLRAAGKEAGFDVECLVPTYRSGAYVTEAELVQAQLKEIGIRLTLKTQDTATFTQALTTGNFKMYVGNNGPLGITNLGLYGNHYTGGAQNRTAYSNPQLDKLIDQQAVLTRDPDARKRILLEIQRLIIDQAYMMNLCNPQQPVMYYPEIKDFRPPIAFSQTSDFWRTAWFDT